MMSLRCIRVVAVLIALGALSLAPTVHASRIEELCEVSGVRPNQLTGYGLVVGLQGSGDSGQARFTVQSTAAMLRRLGSHIDPAQIRTKNAAAVIITATLPAFANPGSRIDVTVSSLGNARSLEGGILVQTPLTGADRRVYAVAQGSVLTGGFAASGRTGSSVQVNHTTVGRIPQGAIVERRVETPEISNEKLSLALAQPSFITAQRIVDAINKKFGERTAQATNPATVEVKVPDSQRDNPVTFLAAINVLDVDPDAPARVVIDERTGTVVLGSQVRIREVAIAQGSLTVEIGERFTASQPKPLASGTTEVVPESDVKAQAAPGVLRHIPNTASLSDVITALNALGATPRDLISIFQALRAAGALEAELEVQ